LAFNYLSYQVSLYFNYAFVKPVEKISKKETDQKEYMRADHQFAKEINN